MASYDFGTSRLSQSSPGFGAASDRSKLHSPPPLPVSMTPPPSSQKPHSIRYPTRTPTPPQSHLSSPPPSARTPSLSRAYDSVIGQMDAVKVATADASKLRDMLAYTTKAYREARASSASQVLQYNLLAMETSEQMKRMGVELEMKNKEVEVLQIQARAGGSEMPTPLMPHARLTPLSPNDQFTANLKNRCAVLEIQNKDLEIQLEDLKILIVEKEAVLKEDNRNLRERIRDNRKHLNMLRQGNALADGLSSVFATPAGPVRQGQDHLTTPRSRGNDDAVSQLLLADQMLSQEANSSPSTLAPGHNRRVPQHQRGAHSLSSLPSTPAQARPVHLAAHTQGLMYGPHYAQNPKIAQTEPRRYDQRRPRSRDSTISASDLDEVTETNYMSSGSHSDREDVGESQASQEARQMLRKSSSFGKKGNVKASQRSQAVAKSSTLLQTKLYGPVKKIGAGSNAIKRKVTEAGSPISAKKARVDSRVGLGIGSWTP